jgi:hypothetical protein
LIDRPVTEFMDTERPTVMSTTTIKELVHLRASRDLDGVAVACGAGVISLGDSAAHPVPVRLRVRAADSRIVVDAGRPFIEQYGDADIDAYRTACQWIDSQSRYEGGGVFRHIEASTERIDESIRDVAPPLFHQTIPGPRPDPNGWAGWAR